MKKPRRREVNRLVVVARRAHQANALQPSKVFLSAWIAPPGGGGSHQTDCPEPFCLTVPELEVTVQEREGDQDLL